MGAECADRMQHQHQPCVLGLALLLRPTALSLSVPLDLNALCRRRLLLFSNSGPVITITIKAGAFRALLVSPSRLVGLASQRVVITSCGLNKWLFESLRLAGRSQPADQKVSLSWFSSQPLWFEGSTERERKQCNKQACYSPAATAAR